MTTEIDAEGLAAYDAGLLNDFGGGNVEWWQDYIRAELGRAHDFYAEQFAATTRTSEAEPVAEVVKTWTRKDGYNGKGVQWRLEPDTLPLGAKLYTLPTPASDDQVEAVRANAVEMLERYADFIRDHVKADDIEMHPYLPELEDTISALAAMGSTKP